PVNGRDQLGGPDPAVVVGVDERRGRGIELEAGGRAGERHPELQVQLVEPQEVGPGLELHLIEPAGAEELPDVCAHTALHWTRPRAGGAHRGRTIWAPLHPSTSQYDRRGETG